MATLTVYIAAPGTPVTGEGNSSFGHMWYQLTSDSGTQSSFGFAPAPAYQGTPFAPGQVYTTDTTLYNNGNSSGLYYSQSVTISDAQYNTLLAFGNAGIAATTTNPDEEWTSGGATFVTYYDGAQNSCIDFVWTALSTVGIQLPVHFPGSDLMPTWNVSDLQSALQTFVAQGSQPTPLTSTYDYSFNSSDDITWTTTYYNASTGAEVGTTTEFGSTSDGAFSSTTTNTNSAGQVTSMATTTQNLSTGASQDSATSYNATTGAELNTQTIATPSGSTITDSVSGTGAMVSLASAAITLVGNDTTATVVGGGNVVTMQDQGQTLDYSGGTVDLGSNGTWDNLVGNNDTFNAGNAINFSAEGTGLTINSTNSNFTLLGDNSTAALSGAKDTVTMQDQGQTLDYSGGTVELGSNGTWDNLVGNDDTFNAGNAINFSAEGTSLTIFSTNSNFTLNGNNSEAVLVGSDNTATMQDQGQTLEYSGGTVDLGSNGTLDNLIGNNDTFNAGNSDRFGADGSGLTINATNGIFSFSGDDSQATLHGAGNSTTMENTDQSLTTTGGTVTLLASETGTVDGSGVTIKAGADDTLVVDGADNTIDATSGDVLDFQGDDQGDDVEGSGYSEEGDGYGLPSDGDSDGGDSDGGDSDSSDGGDDAIKGKDTATLRPLSSLMTRAEPGATNSLSVLGRSAALPIDGWTILGRIAGEGLARDPGDIAIQSGTQTPVSLDTPSQAVARIVSMQRDHLQAVTSSGRGGGLSATVSSGIDQLVQALAALPGHSAASTQELISEDAFGTVPQLASPWSSGKSEGIHPARVA
jgi:hypothetical protein